MKEKIEKENPMQQLQDSTVREINKLEKYSFVVLIIAIISISITPYLFTRNYSGVDFSNTGQIGDTIGGITAPIIGLLSGLLIFLSFRAQIKANQIQVNALIAQGKQYEHDKDLTFIFSLVKEISISIDNQAENKFNKILHSIVEYNSARFNFQLEIPHNWVDWIINAENHNTVLNQITRLLSLFIITINKANETIMDPAQKEYIESTLKFEFERFNNEILIKGGIEMIIAMYNKQDLDSKTINKLIHNYNNINQLVNIEHEDTHFK